MSLQQDVPGMIARNPILKGFAPDPSIVLHDGWYYLAGSSFEWYPTVPIHRSRDLVSWEFAGSFSSPGFLENLNGYADSDGVWAPSLSVDEEGVFWLTFCVVSSSSSQHKELDVYVARTRSIGDPWDPPARVTSTGFDPSIFHHDGRHWLLNMNWNHRPDRDSAFDGITLEELSADGSKTLGEPVIIHRRETLIEGPNMYYRDGWFYLMLAEGGTGTNHGITLMRSTRIEGPYETGPQPDLLTTRNNPEWPLQKAGHGELVQSPSGDWLLVHLASRCEIEDSQPYSMLGRETCVQRVRWDPDGWLRLSGGGHLPSLEVALPSTATLGHAAESLERSTATENATEPNISWPWSTLREPADEDWVSLSARPGWLRLRGRRSPDSLSGQSLVARRLKELEFRASVTVEAAPVDPSQSAGLIVYYNTASYCYLKITVDNSGRRVAEIWVREAGDEVNLTGSFPLPEEACLRLGAERRNGFLQFSLGVAGGDLELVGPQLRTGHLSDDRGPLLRFTGTLIGVSAQDLHNRSFTADFQQFRLLDGERG